MPEERSHGRRRHPGLDQVGGDGTAEGVRVEVFVGTAVSADGERQTRRPA